MQGSHEVLYIEFDGRIGVGGQIGNPRVDRDMGGICDQVGGTGGGSAIVLGGIGKLGWAKWRRVVSECSCLRSSRVRVCFG